MRARTRKRRRAAAAQGPAAGGTVELSASGSGAVEKLAAVAYDVAMQVEPHAEVLDEAASAGTGFLASVCQEWEAATSPAREAGIPMTENHIGGMFGLFFTEQDTVTDFAGTTACNQERFRAFFHAMLERGVYLAPSAFEAGFISAAHSDEDIEMTVEAARRVMGRLGA